jgi:hypothetical protein
MNLKRHLSTFFTLGFLILMAAAINYRIPVEAGGETGGS